jgi:hypothetical protein
MIVFLYTWSCGMSNRKLALACGYQLSLIVIMPGLIVGCRLMSRASWLLQYDTVCILYSFNKNWPDSGCLYSTMTLRNNPFTNQTQEYLVQAFPCGQNGLLCIYTYSMVINVKLFWQRAQRLDRSVVPGWWKWYLPHISRYFQVSNRSIYFEVAIRSISCISIFRSPSIAPARIARWSTSIAQVTKSACRAGVVPPHVRETHRMPGKNWFHLFLLKKNWLVVDLPLWKMMEFLSWDDDIPNIWKVIKFMFQTTN